MKLKFFALFLALPATSLLVVGCNLFDQGSKLPDKPISKNSGDCFIDSQERKDGSVTLVGWAIGEPGESPKGVAVRVLQGDAIMNSFYTTELLNRPDVAAHFKDPSFVKTGFSIKIPSAEAPSGAPIQLVSAYSASNVICKQKFSLK